LDVTSLTLDEFQQLVPPFEAAFQAHMAAWALMGSLGLPAVAACTTTARCRPPRIAYCLFWPM
jgi:hypothetical protein